LQETGYFFVFAVRLMQHHSVLLHINLPLPSHFPLYPTNPLDQITGELQSATLHPRPPTLLSHV